MSIIGSCSKPGQCIESTGEIISKEFNVASFDKIKVFRGISCVVSQGNIQKIEVKTSVPNCKACFLLKRLST